MNGPSFFPLHIFLVLNIFTCRIILKSLTVYHDKIAKLQAQLTEIEVRLCLSAPLE